MTGLFNHVAVEQQLSLVHQLLYNPRTPDHVNTDHNDGSLLGLCTMLLDSAALKQLLFPIIDCLTSCTNKQSNCSGWDIGGYQGFLFYFSSAVFV